MPRARYVEFCEQVIGKVRFVKVDRTTRYTKIESHTKLTYLAQRIRFGPANRAFLFLGVIALDVFELLSNADLCARRTDADDIFVSRSNEKDSLGRGDGVHDVGVVSLTIPPLFALTRLAPPFIPLDLIPPTDRGVPADPLSNVLGVRRDIPADTSSLLTSDLLLVGVTNVGTSFIMSVDRSVVTWS